jgi:hypothetical protein
VENPFVASTLGALRSTNGGSHWQIIKTERGEADGVISATPRGLATVTIPPAPAHATERINLRLDRLGLNQKLSPLDGSLVGMPDSVRVSSHSVFAKAFADALGAKFFWRSEKSSFTKAD